MVHVDFPLQNHGIGAIVSHEAAHCASEEGRYWEMHDAIFENSADLSNELDAEDEQAAIDALVEVGGEIGLDSDALRECLETNRYRPIVGSLQQRALESGISLTPTFLFVTEGHTEPLMGFLSYEEFEPYIEREISRALGTPVPTNTPFPTPTEGAEAP